MKFERKIFSMAGLMVGVAMCMATQVAHAQAPSAADLVDNRAFIKIDKTNTHLGDAFGMHFISPVVVNGVYFTYYIKGAPDGRMAVGLAKSTDGINFTDQGVVLTGGSVAAPDSRYASFPGVWYENGTFYMVFEAVGDGTKGLDGDIGLATSTDGVNFTKQGVILYHDRTGWENINIGTPTLYRENGIWYLHYHGYDGTTCQIGVASGPDLMHLVKYSGNPIIKSIPGTAQAGTAGHRGISKVGGKYYMTYEVSEAKVNAQVEFGGAKWSSSMASSTDLFNWSLYSQNPVLPQTVPSDGMGNDGPTFMSVGGLSYIYYRVTQPQNHTVRALIANESYGGFDISWNMTAPNIGHNIGRAEGDGWAANGLQDAPQYLQFGPYYSALPAGDHIATWSLMIDNNSANDEQMMRLEALTPTLTMPSSPSATSRASSGSKPGAMNTSRCRSGPMRPG